jgi:heptosyltransferase I
LEATKTSPALGSVPLDRVAVVMVSSVGNAVHVLPVINALKRHHPGSHISWIAQPSTASLIRGHPAVDETIVVERSRGWRGLLDLRGELKTRFFDVVLDFQVYLKAGLITALARAPYKLGFDRARTRDLNWLFTTHRLRPRPVGHVQDMFLEFLEPLGVPQPPLEWRIGPWEGEREWQRSFFSRFARPAASLVIGATRPEREWLPERWAQLADALHEEHGLQPVLIGGRTAHEREIERAIRERARHPVISTLGIPLRELVGVLDGSALVVSVNTGPMHMAAALGRPVIGLHGDTNPLWSGPYRYRDLTVDAYTDPGEEPLASTARRPGRMARIGVEDVLVRVARARAAYGWGSPEDS